MKGRPLRGGDDRAGLLTGDGSVQASMKGRPLRGGDLAITGVEIINSVGPR